MAMTVALHVLPLGQHVQGPPAHRSGQQVQMRVVLPFVPVTPFTPMRPLFDGDGVRAATADHGPGVADTSRSQGATSATGAGPAPGTADTTAVALAAGHGDVVVTQAAVDGRAVAHTAAATRATDLADGDAVAGLARGPAGAAQAAGHLDDVIVETGDDVSGAAESARATDATRAAAVTAATGTAETAVERTSRF
jgi:hypothetical protein